MDEGASPTNTDDRSPDATTGDQSPAPARPTAGDTCADPWGGLRRRCRIVAACGAAVVALLFLVVVLEPAPSVLERDLGRMVRRFTFLRGWRHVRDLADPLVILADVLWITLFAALARLLRLALICLGGAIVTTFVSDVILQPIVVRPGLLAPDGTQPPDYFPSSHVVAICCVTAAAVMVIGLGGGSRNLTWMAATLAAVLSGLVAWASVYVRAHFVFDVVAAVAVAAIGMSATLTAALRWAPRPPDPTPT